MTEKFLVPVELPADAASALHAVPKQQLDAGLGPLQTSTALQAAQMECSRLAELGQYVSSGLALSPNASTVTSVSTTIATSLFNKTAHGLLAGDTITFSGIATTTGVTNGVVYFVSATDITANVFRVAATSGGTAITLGGTTDAAITVTRVGRLNMAVGVVFMATTEIKVAAQTAISTEIADMADATNPKWVSVELNSSSVVVFNQGTAAAAPAFPVINTTNTPLGFLYVPSSAVNTTHEVDALLTTSNNKAKLIDARVVKSIHPVRKFASILTRKAQTNPTTAQRIIDTNAITIPDLSASVGDVFMYDMALAYYNPTTARTLRLIFSAFGSTIFDWTSPSLAADANIRMGYIRGSIQIQANTSLNTLCDIVITAPSADYITPPATNAAAVRAAGLVTVGTLATATGLTFDLTAMISGSDAACIVGTNLVNFYKQPV